MFKNGTIADVTVKDLQRHEDRHGWLAELFRQDELDESLIPAMAYISATNPGVVRGPNEHIEQTDYFCFFGPGNFEMTLWDYRPRSPTYLNKMAFLVGEDRPTLVIVPPGVVHAYKNISDVRGFVFKAANRLYGGWQRQEPVDEIQHERNPYTPFKVD